VRAAARFASAAAFVLFAAAAQAQAPAALTVAAEPVCAVVNDVHRPAIQLEWSDSDGASQYDIFRDGSPLVLALSTDTTTYLDLSNDLATTHTYVVHAVNGDGTTLSNSVTASAPASTCPPPPSAPVLAGSAACDASTSPKSPIVNLSWSAAAGATSYDVVRNSEVIETTPATNTTDVGVVAGQTYTYLVRATNVGGSTDSNQVTVAVAGDICGVPPGVFTASTSASCSNGTPKVTVTWTAASGATSYVVDRNDGTVSPPLSASTLTYDDATVSVETLYTYSVNALNNSGSSQSNSFITVPANVCSGGPPSAPSSVTGTLVCNGTTPKVHLAWSGATNATSFSIVRDGSVIASGVTGFTYDDTGVANGQTHDYVVRSVNASGSADSTPVTMRNIFCEAAPSAPALSASLFCVSNTSPAVHLSWSASTGAQTYNVFRDADSVSGVLPPQTLSFDDVTAVAGQTYTYRVVATNTATSTSSNSVVVPVTAAQCGSQSHPDLSVTSVTLSASSGKAGDAVSVSFSIANNGNAGAGTSTLRIRIGTQTTRQSSDLVEASVIVPPIAAGGTSSFKQPIQVPALPSGTYFILVSADDDHTTGDVNASNDTGHSPAFAILGVPQHRRAAGH
jgi:hypothetical protein